MRSATKKRIGKDAAYLSFIRSLMCWVCERGGHVQDGPTEAAHVGQRGLSQKCGDRQTLPLCARHHRTGTASQHRLGKNFFTLHDIDREVEFAKLEEQYEQTIEAGKIF